MSLLAPTEEAQRRMAICQACPFAITGKTKKFFCSKCDCVLAGKTRVRGEKCPVGKW